MIEFLEFTFASAWHFLGVLVLLLAVLGFVEAIINAFAYRLNQTVIIKLISGNTDSIKKVNETIIKDREKIADYLNELTKKNNEPARKI